MNVNIHYHSDCRFFAGCETMLANFFDSQELRDQFNISFTYQYSDIYDKGLKERCDTSGIKLYPLNLLDVERFVKNIKYRPFRIIYYLFSLLTLQRYVCILWNTFVFWRLFGSMGKIDILHVNNGGYPAAYSCFSAVYAAKLRGVEKVVFVVNNIAQSYSFIRWLDYFFDKMLVRCTDLFVTGSNYARKALKNVLQLGHGKIRAIPNGVKIRQFTESKQEVKSRLNINGRKTIGVIALLEERKGHIYLLKAMKSLSLRGMDNLPLLLVEGDEGILNDLVDFVQSEGLTECVRFIGREENIFNLLNVLDVVILPSIAYEDFPIIILEAMGLGKPIIASNISGIPEQIDHMNSGILVNPKDSESLAKYIELLMNDPRLNKQLGEAAFNKFNQSFTSTSSVNNYISLYNDLIGPRT